MSFFKFFTLAFLSLCAVTLPTLASPVSQDSYLILRTDAGDMVFRLFPELAPKHVEQISRLARAGVYDGVPVYLIQHDLIQINDAHIRATPLSAAQQAVIRHIPGEFNAEPHDFGVLSMARSLNDPSSAETSFLIIRSAAPSLNGKFTAFGKIQDGFDILSSLGNIPVDQNNHPLKPLFIQKALLASSRLELQALKLKTQLIPTIPAPQINKEFNTTLAWLILFAYCSNAVGFFFLLKKNFKYSIAASSLSCLGLTFMLLTLFRSSALWEKWSAWALILTTIPFWFLSHFESAHDKK